MASIEKRGGGWRVRWYDPGGRHRSQTFPRKVDAERWVTKVSHDRLTGAYVDPDAGRVTFKAWAEQWRTMKVHRPSTAQLAESHLRLHVYPAIGDQPIASIRPSEVQRLVNSLPLAPATVEVVYGWIANVCRMAVRERLIVATPCVGIELPRGKAARDRHLLTAQQVGALATRIADHYRAAVLLGAGAGLRPGEALGLTVDRVDFLRRTITVDRQMWTPSVGTPRLVQPKTAESGRVIPVTTALTDALAAHLARWPSDGLILRTAPGGAVRRSSYNRTWAVARGHVGPPWAKPHDLRHFYASAIIAQGCDVVTVQRRLGHRSATTTLDIYGHLFHDADDRTREAVEASMADVFR